MTGEIDETAAAGEKKEDRKLAVAIGRAIFRAEYKGQANDKTVRKQAWAEKRSSYAKQGQAVLRQLRKNGFDVTGPTA
ncbi:MAG: hypothetical protein AAF216_01310 [Pseudomonadota bacterium]